MPKLGREAKIKAKVAKSDLPAGLVSVIYFCLNCGGKHTYGADYFVDVGAPSVCPNCGTAFEQDDQVQHYDDESDEVIRMKRDDLHRKRGELVPVDAKPDSPEALKKARIDQLEDEIQRLKGEKPSGIVLGP